MKHTRILDRDYLLERTGNVPSHQIEQALMRTAAELLNTRSVVQAPSEKAPATSFVVGLDERGTYLPPVPLTVVSLTEQLESRTFVAEVIADGPVPVFFRQYVWVYGQPQPEIIAQLGLEVLQ